MMEIAQILLIECESAKHGDIPHKLSLTLHLCHSGAEQGVVV